MLAYSELFFVIEETMASSLEDLVHELKTGLREKNASRINEARAQLGDHHPQTDAGAEANFRLGVSGLMAGQDVALLGGLALPLLLFLHIDLLHLVLLSADVLVITHLLAVALLHLLLLLLLEEEHLLDLGLGLLQRGSGTGHLGTCSLHCDLLLLEGDFALLLDTLSFLQNSKYYSDL